MLTKGSFSGVNGFDILTEDSYATRVISDSLKGDKKSKATLNDGFDAEVEAAMADIDAEYEALCASVLVAA